MRTCGAACLSAWTRADADASAVRVTPSGGGRRRGANWGEQADSARQRDGYACYQCGVTEEELGQRLQVHHRIPFRRFKTNVEANKLEHLVSVCSSCHGQLERQLRKELPLFS